VVVEEEEEDGAGAPARKRRRGDAAGARGDQDDHGPVPGLPAAGTLLVAAEAEPTQELAPRK